MGSTYSTPEPVKEKAALAKRDKARTSIEPDWSTRDTRLSSDNPLSSLLTKSQLPRRTRFGNESGP
jgi:hypothetical protein